MPAIRRAAVTETAIREHAYHLWEKDGRPFGRDQEFWTRATSELAELSRMRKPARAAAAPRASVAKTETPAAKTVKPPKADAPKAAAPKAAAKPAVRRAKA